MAAAARPLVPRAQAVGCIPATTSRRYVPVSQTAGRSRVPTVPHTAAQLLHSCCTTAAQLLHNCYNCCTLLPHTAAQLLRSTATYGCMSSAACDVRAHVRTAAGGTRL